MTKDELRNLVNKEVKRELKNVRQIIREEVRMEFYDALPELINEALGNIIQKSISKKPAKTAPVILMKEATGELPDSEKIKLRDMLGYGKPPVVQSAPVPVTQEVAGVPVDGGLLDKEMAHGVAHMRDYTAPTTQIPMGDQMADAEAVAAPAFNAMPEFLLNAVSKAKKVLDEADAKANWRPGLRRG